MRYVVTVSVTKEHELFVEADSVKEAGERAEALVATEGDAVPYAIRNIQAVEVEVV